MSPSEDLYAMFYLDSVERQGLHCADEREESINEEDDRGLLRGKIAMT
jgi:hypothetical protein